MALCPGRQLPHTSLTLQDTPMVCSLQLVDHEAENACGPSTLLLVACLLPVQAFVGQQLNVSSGNLSWTPLTWFKYCTYKQGQSQVGGAHPQA